MVDSFLTLWSGHSEVIYLFSLDLSLDHFSGWICRVPCFDHFVVDFSPALWFGHSEVYCLLFGFVGYSYLLLLESGFLGLSLFYFFQ